MDPKTAKSLLDRYNAGQINIPPEQIALLQSIAAQDVSIPTVDSISQGGTSGVAPISLAGGNTSSPDLSGGGFAVPKPKKELSLPSALQAPPIGQSSGTSAYNGPPRPGKEDEQQHDVPATREDAIKLATKDSQSGEEKINQQYAEENRDALAAGKPLPYPDIKPADPVKPDAKPEPEDKSDTKPKAKTVSSGPYVAAHNPLVDIENQHYAAMYGTPGKDAVAEIPSIPKYSPAQKAQVGALDKQIQGMSDTLDRINNSTDMTDDTKERLHFETLSRRQKLEDMKAAIDADATKKYGMTKGTPGKEAIAGTSGIVGKIEEGIKNNNQLNQTQADAQAEEGIKKDQLLQANETETAAKRAEAARQKSAYIDDLYKDANDLRNMKYTEDPDRMWNNKNSAQKAAASIAIILGGIGQGLMRGGNNPGVDKLNGEIERDIQAQRNTFEANYRSKKDSFNAKNSLYGKMMDKYNDPVAAAEAAKVVLIDQSARRIENIVNNTNSGRVEQNGKMALTELEKNKADAAQVHALALIAANTPKGTGSGGSIPKASVDDIATGLGSVDLANDTLNEIQSIIKSGEEINTSPSGFRDAQPFTTFTQGNEAADLDRYGKGGLKLKQVVEKYVHKTMPDGEHAEGDALRRFNDIWANGDVNKIKTNIYNEKNSAATNTQRKSQALSTKQQKELSDRVTPPKPNAVVLPPPAARQR